jgi:arylsulfatase A-like enzyme
VGTGDHCWTELREHVAACAKSAAAFLLLLAMGGCGAPQGPPQRIILVTIDTLRADHLGTYGYPRGVSPFLDDLADRSVVFDSAFSSCSHTAPSHASLFTSLQPAQHNLLINGEHLDDRLLTIAEVLSQQGYRTAAFTPVKFLNGLSAGFDRYSASRAYEPAEAVLARALQWLEETGPETRSFVWIHLYDVHEWRAPKRLHRQAVRWVVENAEPRRGKLRLWLREHHGLPADRRESKVPIVRAINRYDGQLYAVDRALKEFYGELGAHGLLNDSIWFITSDHGEGLGNHDRMGHGQYIYDEQIRVPLLVHSPTPRFATGRVLSMVHLVDVAPTIAALVGSNMETQVIPVVGQSILPLLHDRQAPWTATEAFSQRRPADERRIKEGWVPGEVYATRSTARKLIINTEGSCEYYDLGADPFEINNVCDPLDPDIADLIGVLTGAFEAMQSQGEAMQSGVVSPEVIEELKALGYL